jgi:hypothetical protein
MRDRGSKGLRHRDIGEKYRETKGKAEGQGLEKQGRTEEP